MTKRYIRILIGLVIAAIVAIGSYFGVTAYKNKQQKELAKEANKLNINSFAVQNITKIKITNSTGDYEFELDDDEWEQLSGEPVQVNTVKLNAISNNICELKAESILKENATAEDYPTYGLDKPMIVTAVLKDGKEKGVEVGKKVPGASSYYVRVSGEDTIYVISSNYMDNIMAEKKDLKNSYMFDVQSSSEITYLKYTENDEVIYEVEYKDDGWTISAPYDWGVVDASKINSIGAELIRATSMMLEDFDGDLSKYGFDKPRYIIEAKTKDKSIEVLFGDYYEDNETYIYALNKALDQVYVFETQGVGCIGTKTEDMIVKKLNLTHDYLGDIKGFNIDVFGTKIDIDHNYDPENLSTEAHSINGKDIDVKNETIITAFNSLVNAIRGISFEEICLEPDKEALKNAPDVTVVYTLADGKEYKLEFVQTPDDSNMFYALENGKYKNVLVRRYMFENGIVKYYNELMDILSEAEGE